MIQCIEGGCSKKARLTHTTTKGFAHTSCFVFVFFGAKNNRAYRCSNPLDKQMEMVSKYFP